MNTLRITILSGTNRDGGANENLANGVPASDYAPRLEKQTTEFLAHVRLLSHKA